MNPQPLKKNSNAYKMLDVLVKEYPNAVSTKRLRYIVSNTSTCKGVLDAMGLKIDTHKDVLTFSYAIHEDSFKLAKKIIEDAEIITSNPALIEKLNYLQTTNQDLFKKITSLQETIHYLGNENRLLVDKCNQLSNDLILTRATSTMTRENLEKLERYMTIEKEVKKSYRHVLNP